MYYAEREAKNILRKNGFELLDSFYLKKLEDIKKIKNFKFPVVIKIMGKKIIHKNSLGGVKMNVQDIESVLDCFNEMKKIKDFEGIIMQKQVTGKEIFLGLKKTEEFGHVVGFGSGGTDVEKKEDVVFRVIPFDKRDILEMIKETEIYDKLNNKEIENIIKNIFRIQKLSQKFPDISELDVNPLIVNNNFAKIIDARILRDKFL
jgi:hypothetical protein